MFHYIEGELGEGEDGFCVVNAGGVGYKIHTSESSRRKAEKIGGRVRFYVYLHVREEAMDLYGFISRYELILFKKLIGVSGVGPKTGLLLLNFSVDEITAAVSRADLDFFTAIPRLGRKNAQKVIIELKPKLGDLEELNLAGESPETNQALQALTNLGFSKKEASGALKQSPADLDLETRIKAAIKYLGQHG